jgi:hypothetical protein
LGEEEVEKLACTARSRTLGVRLVRRAEFVQHATEGLSAPGIAAKIGLCGATVRFWLKRFNERGLGGLEEDRCSVLFFTVDCSRVSKWTTGDNNTGPTMLVFRHLGPARGTAPDRLRNERQTGHASPQFAAYCSGL